MMRTFEKTGSDSTPQIVFEDNHIIVAIKQPGVLSQADGGPDADMLTLLKQDIKIRYNKPGDVFLGLLHRLDQPVGGLMVFARTSKAASRLSAQIREHKLSKTYLAVVRGRPEPQQGELNDHLLQDPITRSVRVVADHQGQSASLMYKVLTYQPDLDFSLLAIRLITGRGHQIRVQLASRGWPIINDQRYGPAVKLNGQNADIALFAAGLGFFHPVSREWLEFSAVPPLQMPWTCFEPASLQDSFSHYKRST